MRAALFAAVFALFVPACASTLQDEHVLALHALIPAGGPITVGVLPGSVVLVAGERFSLSTFQSLTTAPARPLRDRTVILERREGATYAELVKVVDALILGDCIDMRVLEGES